MKRNLFLLWLLITSVTLSAQNVSNSEGARVYKANIALMVTESYLDMDGDGVSKTYPNREVFKTEVTTSTQQIILEEGFRIVNRENDTFSNIKKVLQEQKLEDYLDGLTVEAKGQGADWLFVVDVTTLKRSSVYHVDCAFRMINIQNNVASQENFHIEQNVNELSTLGKSLLPFLRNFLRCRFPNLLGINSIKGRNVNLFAYMPIGAFTSSDKVYFYRYSEDKAHWKDQVIDIDIMDLVSSVSNLKIQNGMLQVKTESPIKNADNLAIIMFNDRTALRNFAYFTASVFEIPYNLNTYDGYVKKLVNNALYGALSSRTRFAIIENEKISAIKREREVQKDESFIDGHVVEQMKAVGAQYILSVKNCNVKGNDKVSFTIELADVASTAAVILVKCECKLTELENTVMAAVNENIMVGAYNIKKSNKEIVADCEFSLNEATEGDPYSLVIVKSSTDAISGKIVYHRSEICKLKYKEYHGMRHCLSVEKIVDKEAWNNLDSYIEQGNPVYLKEIIDVDKTEDGVFLGKTPKKQKGNLTSSFFKSLASSISVTIE